MTSHLPAPASAPATAVTPDLIGRVQAGDQAAAAELVALTEPMVRRITHAHRPNRMAEEDLRQEVFFKIFTRLRQYRADAPFEHWVSRVAATTCLDLLRAQRRRPELRMADLNEHEAEIVDSSLTDPRGERPGDTLATRDLLHRLLDRLRPEDRRMIVWFELEELSIADIQALTGWTFDFVKMRLFRARLKLKRLWANMSGFDGAGVRPAAVARLVLLTGSAELPLQLPVEAELDVA